MLIAAFILGFTGSLHCIGMCGPIAMMVSGGTGRMLLLNRFAYNAGRTFTYVVMGIVVGLLGKIVQWGGIQGKVSIGVGVLILLILLIPRIQAVFLPSLSKFVAQLKALFGRHLRSQSVTSATATGLLNGFLPCGLVYAGLAVALVQTNVWQSALAMALFGLGTVPALLASAYSWQAVRQWIPWSFQQIQTLMLVIVAAVMLWRGINSETHLFHDHGPDVICTP